MFSSGGLLDGPLIQRRGGGFALGACSQVLGGSGIHVGLDDISHRGIVVTHLPTAAVGLNQFSRRQVVHVALCLPLWLISGAGSGAGVGSCAACVALQLADDLWAVR